MNLDYLFVHLPVPQDAFPWFKPDGLGMSILLTSPGLLYAVRAPWRESRTWWLGGWPPCSCSSRRSSTTAAAGSSTATATPSTRSRSSGCICGLAARQDEERGQSMSWTWRSLIVVGVIVGLGGVYWAYNLR